MPAEMCCAATSGAELTCWGERLTAKERDRCRAAVATVMCRFVICVQCEWGESINATTRPHMHLNSTFAIFSVPVMLLSKQCPTSGSHHQ